MSTLLPQLQVKYIGRNDLLVSSEPVLLLDEIHESVVDASTVGHPEGRPGRQVVEEKQLLLGSQCSVVTFLGLLLELLPLLQLALVREGDTVHLGSVREGENGREKIRGERRDVILIVNSAVRSAQLSNISLNQRSQT